MEKKRAFMFYFCTRGHITKQSGEVKEGMPTLAEILPWFNVKHRDIKSPHL